MLGAIIGDIVGSRFEFNNTNRSDFKLFHAACSFTDDTICTVAIADALVNGKSYKDALHEWCNKYPYPMGGYGGRFAQWVASKDPRPYDSFGNGSAMRVSPVAWWFNHLTWVLTEAEMTAMPTHNHPEGIKGAVAVAHAISHLRLFDDIPGLINIANSYYPDFQKQVFIPGKFDETCVGTVPLAFQILLASTSFENAIRRAVAWGGDSDTLAAIVGSMAEALWGIPDDLRQKAYAYLPEDMLCVIYDFNKKRNA